MRGPWWAQLPEKSTGEASPRGWEQVHQVQRRQWEQQQAEDRTQQRHSGPGWHGMLDGYAPVQGHGIVDGHAWYFRARWAGWSFEIAEAAEVDWAAVDLGQDVGGWRIQDQAWGEDEYAASYMPYATAWAIIQQCITRFRDGLLTSTPARAARP
jgi:hypothetical protein